MLFLVPSFSGTTLIYDFDVIVYGIDFICKIEQSQIDCGEIMIGFVVVSF